jgi:tetratricopeptide (TPR) repeat protein
MCLCTSFAHAFESSAGPGEGPIVETPVEAPDEPGEPSVDEALESGDLSLALDQARMQREADPSPANWRREAQVLEQMGQLEAAASAYEAELAALPEDDEARREAARADLERVRAAERGTVADEPASTHRAELDERRAPKATPKPPPPRREPLPPPVDDEKIVRKWYFWVTIAAIAASAAAVTGIAVKAARDRRRDSLDLTRDPGTMPPPLFRF